MKNLHRIYTFLLALAVFTACKKEDLKEPPQKSTEVEFVIRALPDSILMSVSHLWVTVTLKNHAGQEVVRNKKLTVPPNSGYITEKLSLPDSNYSLTQFIVWGNNGTVLFASPISGSAKASQLQTPLPIQLNLPGTGAMQQLVEVLPVEAGDAPQLFGYPVNAFQQQPQDGHETFKVKLQAVVTIGSITYDNITAPVRITSWDANGLAFQKDTILPPGVNLISLPKSHTRYQFILNKWGIADSTELLNNQVQEDVVYTLGGNKAAKKLHKEESFLFVMNTYQPSSKTLYTYNTRGLSAVEYYQKKPQSAALQFTQKHLYNYSGNNITRINVYDENNLATGFTDFTYNAQGTRVTHMHQKLYDVETFAVVDHSFPAGSALITIDYLYNNGNSMEYKMKIIGGNKTEDVALSSTGGSEGGSYKYDHNINPFAHMNMPNIFLSNLSRNNLIDQQKNYSGSIPSGVVYKYEYVYDHEGYPIELVKHYKSYLTGEHLYKIKTIYTY